MTVEEVSTLEGLETLRGAWEEAQARSAPDNVFVTFDWALAWWRHFGAGRRLRVLVVRRGADPAAILPLWEGPLGSRWLPFRRIQILGTGLSDRLDLLLCGDPAASAEAALRHLLARPARWDVLELREVPEESEAVEAIRTAAARLGLECEVAADSECHYVPIRSDWETFFATRFGRRQRKTLNHNARRLEAKCGPVSTTFNAVPDDPALLARLAAMPQEAVYHGADRLSIFGSGPKRAFFEEVVQRFSRRGWLRLGVLELKGELAAFRLAFRYAGKHIDYFTGFHRDYAKVSPGAVLLAQVMEDCFRDRLREVDFLRGAEPWKAVWTDERRRNVRLRVYRSGPGRPLVRLLYRMKDRPERTPQSPAVDADTATETATGGESL
jgi:CelD/BcsL family acetyltransferase involved in cellulose biosynthesis